ncbi:MAG: triose-phosphate isomerase, partial [Alphaproteobacteria bacterium]
RRHGLGESDELVAAKTAAAHAAGLIAIVCIGETEAERDGGKTLDVLGAQIAGSLPDDDALDGRITVIAYEPVWAIGTGRTPTVEQVAEAHAHMRRCLTDRVGDAGKAIRLLYGGSVKPDNAGELMAVGDVDGALVGGAALNVRDFCAIAAAAVAAA